MTIFFMARIVRPDPPLESKGGIAAGPGLKLPAARCGESSKCKETISIRSLDPAASSGEYARDAFSRSIDPIGLFC